jgi:hypothetical protein
MKLKWMLSVALSLGVVSFGVASVRAQAQQKPNILIIWGDDIGGFNISAYNQGVMGYKTPNIMLSPEMARCSRTGMGSRVAPQGARPSLPGNRQCERASPRLACPALRKA